MNSNPNPKSNPNYNPNPNPNLSAPAAGAPSPAELRLKREIAALKSLLPSPIGVGNQFPSSVPSSKKRQRFPGIEEWGGLNSSTSFLSDDNNISGGKDIELTAEKLARERDAERYSMALSAADSLRSKLERQVNFLAGEEEAAREELATKQRAWLEEKMSLQSELRRVRDLLNALEDKNHKLMQAAMEAKDATGKLHAQAISQSVNTETEGLLREELEMARESLADVREELNNACLRAELEEKKVEAAVQDVNPSLRMTVNDLERKLHRRDETIEMLKKGQQGKEELQEQILVLQSKFELVKKQLKDEQEASVSCEMLKEERLEWEAMFSKLFESSSTPPTPSMALKLLTKVQQDNIYLQARATQWETRASQATERLKLARSETAAEANRRSSAETSLEEIRLRLQGETRKSNTLEKELVAQKELIQSFRLLPPGSSGKRENSSEKNALEVALDTARLELKELRGEVVNSTPGKVLEKTQERVRELEEICRKLEQERCAATKQLERVERELAAYEREAATGIPIEGKGRSGAPTAKILHLISNPAAIALAKGAGAADHCVNVMESSLIENSKDPLDDTLRDGGNGSSSSSRRTAKISGKSSGKIHHEEEVDKDKVNQRLKEKFKERIGTFRNAIYLLTGYKIDMTTEGDAPQLRLRSMYSEQENDDLVFQWNKEGLQLMETSFAKKLDRKIFTYLSTCHSVPAFLSNLTLELFEKRTFAPGSMLST